jgi:hypothetical protein
MPLTASNHPLKRILASKRPSTSPDIAKRYNPGVGTHSTLPTDRIASITESSRSKKVTHPSEGPFSICHRRLLMRPIAQSSPLLSRLNAQRIPLFVFLISGGISPSHHILEAGICSGLLYCLGMSLEVIG